MTIPSRSVLPSSYHVLSDIIYPFVEQPPNPIDIQEPANEAVLRLSNPRFGGENPLMAMPLQNPPQNAAETREKMQSPASLIETQTPSFGLVFGTINTEPGSWMDHPL